MRRRDIVLMALLSPLAHRAALAQAAQKVWRVGVLTPNQFGASTIRSITLPELAKLGFVEGRNLSLHVYSADEAHERLTPLGAELVATGPDAIIAVGPSAIRAARAATSTIPIVMSFGGEDPVAAGWAQSYARPGGNITGVVLLSPELDAKRLYLLHDTFPERRRIGVLFHARSRNTPTERAVHDAARALGLEILSFYASGDKDYAAAFDAIRSSGADALLIASSPIFSNDAALLAELALNAGAPTICEWRDMAEKGCLIAYGVSRAELRRRTAHFLARIFQGTPAAEIPIEDPTTFELAVNLRTARALAIEVPSRVLALADEVTE